MQSAGRNRTLTVASPTVLYRRFIYRRFSASVLPINRIHPPALVAFRVFHSLGNDGTARTSRAHEVRLPHDAPPARPLAADLEVAFRAAKPDVMAVNDDVPRPRHLAAA